ncbi:formyltransferase family protein [Microbacterium sp. A196]|uniref:formyltransferase family protein n=1 Tax=Microbacterium sp. A196 TaxID=3457320 RepID=UPI003FD0589D
MCCGWARRIPARVFTSPRHGTLNLHPGSLPSWSGSDPLGWRRAAGPDTIEATVHRMTELIDQGEVLGTAVFAVDVSDTGHDLRHRAGDALGTLAARVISSGLTVVEKAASPAARATPPRGVTPAIEPLLMQRVDVERVVRSFSPYPGVLAMVEGSWIRVRSPEGNDAVTCVLRCADDDLRVETSTCSSQSVSGTHACWTKPACR